MDCPYPLVVKKKDGKYIEVPCGHCIQCRIARSRDWSTRLAYENMSWKDSIFLTLTYDDDHVRFTNCGVPTLCKHDLQLFWKSLRNEFVRQSGEDKNNVRKFKYYACGEYGDLTERPHYHAIVFGLSVDDLKILQQCWPNGFVSVNIVNGQTIDYVTGYVRKKYMKYDKSPEGFSCLHRVPQFQCSSQGLGLKSYDSLKWKTSHRTGRLVANGHDVSIPRYFLKKDEDFRNNLNYHNSFNMLANRQEANRRCDEAHEEQGLYHRLEYESRLIKEANIIAREALHKKGNL